ncbi:glutathionylspermidine synthase family protein [Paenibacillus tarimensis]|uniref:glutathionylspermidine synthase family protein n=1 Tax=Paenibacillus tarimensis TaxID=416012 RepID=UPI001F413C98|nr:glutathionylspermidine synthase family protein [Paenibacillus tarimensis]MCF2943475.1 glutathionylspermidine synthase family protein [Paenibacillus tarimensis]
MSDTAPVFEVFGQPAPDRQQRVRHLRELGFGWADLEEEVYWIDQAAGMRRDVYDDLMKASAELWRIFDKAARYVIRRHDLYQLIGIPELLWDLLDELPVNEEEGKISRYARFDFAVSESGDIKLLELNADTPTGYAEASVATPWLCRQLGLDSPNEQMADRVAAAWAVEQPEAAACVSYGSHLEDSGTIELLVKHSGLDMRCVDCLDLWVDEGVLRDAEGRAIERLFALYPKEWMAVDEGGDALAYAIETGKLQLFNHPHAIILQSKGLMAVIWGMYELGILFTASERDAIARYMLPTYNKAVFDGSFVSKSMFGREGGSVQLFGEDGGLEVRDEDGYDTSSLFPLVYQKRAELAKIRTAAGELHLLTGVFVINGEPCGLLGRAGGLITGNTSHFIAIGVRD